MSVCGVGAFWRIYIVSNTSLWLILTNRPEWRDKRRCFGLMREPVSVNRQTAAGAGEFWKRQQWTEPTASGGINTRS